ncbi:MAG: hypothetical protein ABIN18_17240, partial [Pseudomonadota bacterium]
PQLNRSQRNLTGQAESQRSLLNRKDAKGAKRHLIYNVGTFVTLLLNREDAKDAKGDYLLVCYDPGRGIHVFLGTSINK